MIQIKLIKDWQSKKAGDLINISENGAASAVAAGVAEYLTNSPQETQVKTPVLEVRTNEELKVRTNNNDKNSTFQREMICDRNDMNDINDMEKGLNISNISNISHIKACLRVLGRGVKEQVLSQLYCSDKALNYEEMARFINKDIEYVRTVINRDKGLFEESQKEGNTKLFTLSRLGNEFVSTALLNDFTIEFNRIKTVSARQEELKQKDEMFFAAKRLVEFINFVIVANSAYIKFEDLLDYDPAIADLVLDKPAEFITHIEISLEEKFDKKIKLRILNLPKQQRFCIESLRAEQVDTLITIEGRIVSLSNVRPQCTNAKFECPNCGAILSVLQIDKKFREPSRCTCGWKSNFRRLSKELANAARFAVEDLQDNTESSNLKRLNCYIRDDLVSSCSINIFNPGNEVRINGILREVEVPLASGAISVVSDLALEVISVEPLSEEVDVTSFTEEEVEVLQETAFKIKQEGIEHIVSSFAPDVYGYPEIKKALILQASCKRNDLKKKKTKNKINILMVGDPGIAKSVMSKFAVEVTPHSKVATGGTSSGVGITASVVKEDDELGGYRVEPGAIILAKELLVIEELNNMKDEDKSKMQEALSEQTVTVNKANIHHVLKTTCGVIGTANPKHGSFNPTENYVVQFNIPSPILNRFDLVFALKDEPNFATDEQVANIMLNREREKIKPLYSKDYLKKFFAYIRAQPEPEIDEELASDLKHLYAVSRKKNDGQLIINARFMEALIRLIKASARLRLSYKVEMEDVKRAFTILSKSHFSLPDYESLFKKPLEKQVKDEESKLAKQVVIEENGDNNGYH